eukprot:130775-Prymnesium_polylepis.1
MRRSVMRPSVMRPSVMRRSVRVVDAEAQQQVGEPHGGGEPRGQDVQVVPARGVAVGLGGVGGREAGAAAIVIAEVVAEEV